jgi:hypothetical protein
MRQNHDALFLIKVFNTKTDYCSVMDSTFNVSNVSRLGPSAGHVTAANNIHRSVHVFNKHTVLLEDTFSFL